MGSEMCIRDRVRIVNGEENANAALRRADEAGKRPNCMPVGRVEEVIELDGDEADPVKNSNASARGMTPR